ncbi:MAG: MarC family protein [Alcanivoracaceae bacterium]
MTDTAIVAFATFIATIGPVDVAAIFAALTANASPQHRRTMALRGTLIAAVILVLFALVGERLLSTLGITLAALRTAGGVLLLLIGIDMVFARDSGAVSTTDEEELEAASKADISVFPIATPLIAGPGAMGAAILLMADAEGDVSRQFAVMAALAVALILTLISLLLASQIHRLLGVTGMHVISRVMGILLAALAVQFVFDGVSQSGIFSG